ncbi:putative pentatricopeptide repeat-containing protein At2g01510 [Selaginella moellendorffii]|uniref:putative pentatricopeptide repeat-containing protein At2g01510 n=1 Tax=Selaginella moellendorffii TaxID=88036 RepID=UPI000D1CA528|nr:putative pentatricopeptide repeat-containing protein At2g01510 [Selaginella moellendorffii]|eukprot:XP_024542615.1 putative pentatricopeptide repeat-containing protein At2g01510 [Selaginella moellendorffii]
MLGGYSRLGDARKTARLFQLMPERDILSWTALLTAHAYGRNIYECRRIFSEMPYHDTASEASMLGAYALAGNLEDAQRFFAGMGVRNVVAWTCLVGAYARAGRFQGALDVFRTMVLDGIRPNEISLCCVLLGCSHGGMVSDGWDCFRSMAGDHGLRPLKEHYGCMVDLLSRAGHLRDAQDLVWNMPFIPDEVEWTSLLGK